MRGLYSVPDRAIRGEGTLIPTGSFVPTKPAVSARPSSGDAEMSASNSEPEENSWGSKEQKLRLNRGTEGKKVQRRGSQRLSPGPLGGATC